MGGGEGVAVGVGAATTDIVTLHPDASPTLGGPEVLTVLAFIVRAPEVVPVGAVTVTFTVCE